MPTAAEEKKYSKKRKLKRDLGIGRSQVTYGGALSMGAEARLQFAA